MGEIALSELSAFDVPLLLLGTQWPTSVLALQKRVFGPKP